MVTGVQIAPAREAEGGLGCWAPLRTLPGPVSVFLLQGPEHPNPGKPFTARGFPRQCYLPDNAQGRKVRQGAPAGRGPAACGRLEQVGGWGGPSLVALPALPCSPAACSSGAAGPAGPSFPRVAVPWACSPGRDDWRGGLFQQPLGPGHLPFGQASVTTLVGGGGGGRKGQERTGRLGRAAELPQARGLGRAFPAVGGSGWRLGRFWGRTRARCGGSGASGAPRPPWVLLMGGLKMLPLAAVSAPAGS